MHRQTKAICFGLALAAAIGLPTHTWAKSDERTPCLTIKQVCEEAGFKQDAVAQGTGLQIDCIRPIIEGRPQRQKAAKPLPTVDAAVVAACKARNPTFGIRKNDPPDQPTSGSDF